MNKSRRDFIKLLAIAGAGMSVPVIVKADPTVFVSGIRLEPVPSSFKFEIDPNSPYLPGSTKRLFEPGENYLIGVYPDAAITI